MSVTGGEVPGFLSNSPSACGGDFLNMKTVCSKNQEIQLIKNFLIKNGFFPESVKKMSDEKAISTIKNVLGIDSELDIYKSQKYTDFIGERKAQYILDTRFKPVGPAFSTELLDNFNIDKTLSQLANSSMELYKKKVYNIPFQMIDFQEQNTELANLDIAKLKKLNFDLFVVVLNTDVSSGRGKHWFALCGDLEHAGTEADPIFIEYFNSSGLPARPEVSDWIEKQIHNLRRDSEIVCERKNANQGYQLQYSNTECGVWSLLYLISRVTGKPAEWMIKVKANDADMIKFRNMLFRI